MPSFLYPSSIPNLPKFLLKMETLTFSQLQEELSKPNTVLIDVRPPEEIKTDGKIAGSKNIPSKLKQA